MSEIGPERSDAKAPSLFDRLRGLIGMPQASARDDIEEAIAESSESGELSQQERSMLTNVLGLHDVRVADIMVPRSDVVAVKIDATLGDVLALFRTAGHSRFPVHGETLDDPRGMVHIRDFLDHIAGAALARRLRRAPDMAQQGQPARRLVGALDLSTPLEDAHILRQPLFVPPSMPALDLLRKMQQTHTHMALVIDEYGGVDGLVSMEDVVEAIVGDIADEHDEDEAPSIQPDGEGVFLADARASLEEAQEATGLKLSEHDDAEDVDTLGGLVATLAGRVPTVGEIIEGPEGSSFEIVEADPKRVKRVRVRLAARAGEASGPGES
jgi:CBS domain containing-hemolysin-like protein